MTSEGAKHDEGKPDYSLIPVYALEQMAKVLTFGKEKYSRDNWRKGVKYSRGIAAIERHLASYKSREDIDPESSVEHLAHIMCSCAFLMEFKFTRPELDDRPLGAVNREGLILDVAKESDNTE